MEQAAAPTLEELAAAAQAVQQTPQQPRTRRGGEQRPARVSDELTEARANPRNYELRPGDEIYLEVAHIDRWAGVDHLLFQRGTVIVQLHENKKAEGLRYRAVQSTNDSLRAFLPMNKIRFFGLRIVPISPTEDEVRPDWKTAPEKTMASFLRAPFYEHIKPLLGFTHVPTFRADGSLITANGYDEATGYFVDAPEDVIAAVASAVAVSKEQCRAELDALLATYFDEVPFADDADKTAFLAHLLTPLVRPAVGMVPMFVYDAPAAGTGKTYLCQSIGCVYSGAPTASSSMPANEEEFRKHATSVILGGQPHWLIDNVVGKVSSPTLAVLLTSPQYSDRILGASRSETFPNTVVIALSSNNAYFNRDMLRRIVRIRLDAKMHDPHARTFKNNLHERLTTDRALILRTLATVILSYRTATQGRVDSGRVMASYESWSRWCHSPLTWLGYNGFVDRAVDEVANNDSEDEELARVHSGLATLFGEEWFTAAQLREQINSTFGAKPGSEATAAEVVREVIASTLHHGRELTPKAIGEWLAIRRERRTSTGMRLEQRRKAGTPSQFRVVSDNPEA